MVKLKPQAEARTAERERETGLSRVANGGPDARCTVLILDPNREMRAYVRRCLLPMSHRIHHIVEAANGRESVRLTSSEPIDLVIVDTPLPSLDGSGLEASLRMLQPAALVLMVEEGDAHRPTLGFPAEGRLIKPFDGRTFQRCVHPVLEQLEIRKAEELTLRRFG